MKLTDKSVNAAKPAEKSYKLADGGGLYIEVLPSGSKSWRMKYRFDGGEKRLTFGLYPIVTLKDARNRAHEARKLLSEGIDPSKVKAEARQARQVKEEAAKADEIRASETFEMIGREWFEKFSSNWKESHSSKIIARLLLRV